jgi:hypothetical protein
MESEDRDSLRAIKRAILSEAPLSQLATADGPNPKAADPAPSWSAPQPDRARSRPYLVYSGEPAVRERAPAPAPEPALQGLMLQGPAPSHKGYCACPVCAEKALRYQRGRWRDFADAADRLMEATDAPLHEAIEVAFAMVESAADRAKEPGGAEAFKASAVDRLQRLTDVESAAVRELVANLRRRLGVT